MDSSFCVCSTSAISVPSIVLKRCRKEHRRCRWKRVTAKSKPMMNWVSRCIVRDPNVLASTASESPEKTKSESQNVPVSSLNVQQTSMVRPVLDASSSNYSEWNIDLKWSSQVWNSGEMLGSSTGRPVDDKFVIDENDMDSDTATESNLSLRSRSFLNKVNDRLRKILDHSSKDAMQDIDKHSMIWRKFMSSTLEASVCMGKNYSENFNSIKNTGTITLWNKCLTYLKSWYWNNQMRFFGVLPISWDNSLWKRLSLVNDEEVISLSHAEVYVFSDSVLCLGRMNENPQSKMAWEDKLTWFKSSSQYRTLDRIDGESTQDSTHCSSATKSKSSCQKWAKSQNNSQDGSSSCRCSTISHGDLKTMIRSAN